MSLSVSHHLLLCATPTKPACCEANEGLKSWQALKRILHELKLEDPQRPEGIVLRSKIDCLRICKQGPILLIWPDGIWYYKVSPVLIEKIVREHIIRGKPIKDYILKKTPLMNKH